MMNPVSVDVRIDCLKTGKIIPISYIDEFAETHYIRNIDKITNENNTVYYCNLRDGKVKLICADGRWYYTTNLSDMTLD